MNKLKCHKSDNRIEDQQLVLSTQHMGDDDTVQEKDENNNFAAMDRTCSSKVCGENGLNKYQNYLSM